MQNCSNFANILFSATGPRQSVYHVMGKDYFNSLKLLPRKAKEWKHIHATVSIISLAH